MEHACTTCCRLKHRDPGLLSAAERYLSPRISWVLAVSARAGRPALILSGRYGLLAPGDPIPWYDQALEPAAVAPLAAKVAGQLEARGADRLRFFARPRTTPGWEPYFAVLEGGCERAGVELSVVDLGSDFMLI